VERELRVRWPYGKGDGILNSYILSVKIIGLLFLVER